MHKFKFASSSPRLFYDDNQCDVQFTSMLNSDSGDDLSSGDETGRPETPPPVDTDSDSDTDALNSGFPVDPSEQIVVGKDLTKWHKVVRPPLLRASAANVFRASPGISSTIRAQIQSPYDAWKLFINERMLRLVQNCTTANDSGLSLPLSELETFIGLQYCRGIYGKNHPVKFLWSTTYGPAIFRSSMTRDRFTEILKHLRFDIKSTRSTRLQNDKFALVSELFEQFRTNCNTKYTPQMFLTADEQLQPLKSRCNFITFMPNKPD